MSQSADSNYVRTDRFLDAAGQRRASEVSYQDGIGRTVEMVTNVLSTSGGTSAALHAYDLAGRETVIWLPGAGGKDLGFVGEEELKQRSQDSWSDAAPYSITSYDALDRKTTVMGAGEDWHANGRAAVTAYVTNEANSVRFYTAPIGQDKGLECHGCYPACTLDGESTTDEDGRTLTVFKDPYGRKVLERRGKDNDTYFVYNALGELRYVLPPMYQEEADDSGLEKYGYEYRYDRLMRCVWRRLPGCEPVQYWYDSADRISFMQDGLLRDAGRYRFYLYDRLGRLAVQGTCSDVPQDTTAVTMMLTSSPGLLNTGYTLSIGASGEAPSLAGASLELANYYDSYAFLSTPAFQDYEGRGLMTKTQHSDASGLQTGTMTVCSDDSLLLGATYYDPNGLETERLQGYPGGRLLQVCTAYTYTDKPHQTTYTLWNLTGGQHADSVTLAYTYSPDNDALLTVSTSSNGGPAHVTSQLSYDELGRIVSKILPGQAGSTAYGYNVRGWKTLLSHKAFTEMLHYTDGPGTACYSGDISSQEWTDSRSDTQRGYTFAYDELDRLTDAVYGEGNGLTENRDRYSEKAIGYNRNGAITTLSRYGRRNDGSFGLIDDLTIDLDGNRPRTVSDAAGSLVYANSFDFKQNSDESYTYNANGALLRDPNKMDADITYDLLGWPVEIPLQRATNHYVYSARGEKLRVWTQLNGLIPIVPPVRPAESNATTGRKAPTAQDLKPGHPLLRHLRDTRYCGPFILEQGKLSMFLFDGGYISFDNGQPAWHYYVQDHLGNTRAVINEQGQVEQATNYYPFGGVYGNEELNAQLQPYKYNGKELDHTSGLDWYDYGARMYDPALAQWNTVDPLTEKYYYSSLYNYCLNKPIGNLDPDGRKVRPAGGPELAMIMNTLSEQDKKFVKVNNAGYIDPITLNSHNSNSGNYQSLLTLVNSDIVVNVSLTSHKFNSIDNQGNIHTQQLTYGGVEQGFEDTNFTSPSGLSTGETGKYAVTLLPGQGESGVNSPDKDIHIYISDQLTPLGRAEAYSHEGNGHAYLYIKTGSRKQSAHFTPNGLKEENTILAHRILESRRETYNNFNTKR